MSLFFGVLTLSSRSVRGRILRPDGKKKAYVRLTADHDALDVANKVSRRFELSQSRLLY
jgi:hypothetical protein